MKINQAKPICDRRVFSIDYEILIFKYLYKPIVRKMVCRVSIPCFYFLKIYFVFNSCSRKYANQCISVYSK